MSLRVPACNCPLKQTWPSPTIVAPDESAMTDACERLKTAGLLPQQLAAWWAIARSVTVAMHDVGKAAGLQGGAVTPSCSYTCN
jgi:hypothetical protein